MLLRPPTEDDAADFVARMRASRSLHRPWVRMPETPAEYASYLERSRRESCAFFLACRIDDGAITGFLNLSEIVRGKLQSAYLGYGAVAGHAGQGYLGEAMALLQQEAFRVLRLHRLEANIQPANTASIALAARAGFRYEGFSPRYLKVGGRWRDHERWAITREDWLAARRRSPAAAPPEAPRRAQGSAADA